MLILFFIPPLYISGHVAQKQIEFSKLKGTTFRLDPLDESPASYLRVLPQAAANTFIRPFPWEVKGILQLLASAEVVAFWIVLILSIVYRHPYWKLRLFHPVILMICSLAVSMYLVTGFIVPYPGAIVRYKSIAEILLLCVAVSLARHHDTTNYKKI